MHHPKQKPPYTCTYCSDRGWTGSMAQFANTHDPLDQPGYCHCERGKQLKEGGSKKRKG